MRRHGGAGAALLRLTMSAARALATAGEVRVDRVERERLEVRIGGSGRLRCVPRAQAGGGAVLGRPEGPPASPGLSASGRRPLQPVVDRRA